jgi:hypothetical protein
MRPVANPYTLVLRQQCQVSTFSWPPIKQSLAKCVHNLRLE